MKLRVSIKTTEPILWIFFSVLISLIWKRRVKLYKSFQNLEKDKSAVSVPQFRLGFRNLEKIPFQFGMETTSNMNY